MDPPPPSQSQAAPKTTLFSNPDGTPIRVFIQTDLFGRAKLVKNLRLNGAELLSDATNAQIMLVDPTTRQGRQFIRDWGQDSNKMVLNFTWVNRSLEAQRPQLAEDKWGNCLAQDDGRPIDSGEELQDVVHDIEKRPNPLPTPRVTPEDARKRSKESDSRQASVTARNQPDDVPMAASMPLLTAGHDPLSIPSEPIPSQFSPTGISPMSGMNPFMNPVAMNMQNISSSVLAFTAQAAQAVMANMLMNMNPNLIPNQQPFSNDAFMLALQDSMRNHVAAGWPVIQPQNGTFSSSQSVSPLPEPPLPYPSAPSSSKRRKTLKSWSPMSEPSAVRSVSSASEFSRRVENKEKISSPATKRRKVSSSSAKDIEMDDVEAPSRINPSTDEKLFRTKSGRPLGFFVQIEIHNRFNLVSSIKKNGGIIVDTPTLADYAILYSGNQRQKVFKTLLQAAQNAEVPAVQAKFLHECLSRKKLLDPTDYQYEPELKQKRKRSVSTVESEDDMPEKTHPQKNKQQVERKMNIKRDKTTQNANASPASVKVGKVTPKLTKSVDVSYPRASGGPRTPSPPPESALETCPQGYKFSRAENDFALRFAKVMIDRDYTISQSAVVNAIHKKLPHHSLLSWRSHFSGMAAEWDTWRKRAAIAHRKAQLRKAGEAASSSSAPMEVTEAEDNPFVVAGSFSSEPFAPILDANSAQISEQDLQDDLNTVVRFFVDGNDRDHTEDESLVWQRLEAKTVCKTESSWEVFYAKHSEVVVERFNALTH